MLLCDDVQEVSNNWVFVDMIKYLPSIVDHTVESNGPVCYVYSQ